MDSWRYYNHALIPNCAPHETPNISALENKQLWRSNGAPLLARWTSDYDCKYNTQWWYVIKDEPFNIEKLKSNYRYKINKGLRLFDIRKIDPLQYTEELFQVQVDAFSAYPQKIRPIANKDNFIKQMTRVSQSNGSILIYAAFFKETEELCGYTLVPVYEKYADLQTQKTKPLYEKYQLNAALVYGVLDDFKNKLGSNFYICDGTRSINHETAFQDYLEKYFGFRKAYCKLHIKYSRKILWIVKLVFPFRKFIRNFDKIGAIHSINAILKMEEITRSECNNI